MAIFHTEDKLSKKIEELKHMWDGYKKLAEFGEARSLFFLSSNFEMIYEAYEEELNHLRIELCILRKQ